MGEWKPTEIKAVKFKDRNGHEHHFLLGNDGNRFYTKPLEGGEWESCLEYKHDYNVFADIVAKYMFDRA